MLFSHLKHQVAYYCGLCCTKAKKEWEQFWEFWRGKEFTFHLEAVGDSKIKTLWKRWYRSTWCFHWLSLSQVQVAIIDAGEVHIVKNTEGAFLTEIHYARSTAVIVSKKRVDVFWWKRGEVHLIHDRLMTSHGVEIVEEGFEDIFQETRAVSQNRKVQLLHGQDA